MRACRAQAPDRNQNPSHAGMPGARPGPQPGPVPYGHARRTPERGHKDQPGSGASAGRGHGTGPERASPTRAPGRSSLLSANAAGELPRRPPHREHGEHRRDEQALPHPVVADVAKEDDIRRIVDDIRDGRPVSPDDVFHAMQPSMRVVAPLFDRMRVKELSSSGLGPAAIARELGMAPSSVYRLLEEAVQHPA